MSKGRALQQFLGGVKTQGLLDVGAGSGVFSRQLLDAGVCQHAVCVDPGYAKEHVESNHGREPRFTRSVNHVPEKLILMMDVLEHVDNDVALLREYTDRMPADGLVLITVPAFQFLWSGHDVFLEHRRRYTKETIATVVRAAGLRVVRSRYFFGMLFPLLAVMRLTDRFLLSSGRYEAKSSLKKSPDLINNILTKVHDIERAVLFPLNRFAGLTVFCLAKRA